MTTKTIAVTGAGGGRYGAQRGGGDHGVGDAPGGHQLGERAAAEHLRRRDHGGPTGPARA
ncbi:hypothetical protein [Nocardia wallacei]|uniref:hypothetical protein n=1 Tax=Nocardia wallacei TaxID=480035 RepID=UPI0024546A8B|nr:hypothetical protein [Nocardia wallacei]